MRMVLYTTSDQDNNLNQIKDKEEVLPIAA
jgi:hypothetical protein